MNNSDRARQFMPFSPLKGYDELVKSKEKVIAPKKELSEYRAELLSSKLISVKKGDIISVIYYNKDGYVKKEGMVANIDFNFRYLTIIKTKISFDDIYNLKVDSLQNK